MKKFYLATLVICLLSGLFVPFNINAQFREKYHGSDVNNDIVGMSFLSPTTGFVAFDNFIGFTQDSGQTYIQRYITPTNVDFNGYSVNLTFGFIPKGVHAFTTDSLFVHGNYGGAPAILFSANQGQTWKLVNQRPFVSSDFYNNIFDIKFPGNGNIGIAVHHTEILRSTNRGQSWSPISFNTKLEKLSFPSSTTGYALGEFYLMKTTNSGATWSTTNMPSGTSSSSFYDNVFFVNNSLGYMTENFQDQVYKTANGGSTWTKMNNASVIPIDGIDLAFINDSTGFMCKPFEYSVYKTSDSGKTWEPCKKNSNFSYLGYGFNRMHFNNQVAWAGGAGEYLMIASPGVPVNPKAFFAITSTNDTATPAVFVTLSSYSKPNYQHTWYKNGAVISTSYNTTYTHLYFPLTDTIKLVVSNGVDSDTSIQYINFPAPPPFPSISSFSPASGCGFAEVMIYGTNFTGVTGVSFGGVPAAYFQVFSNTQIFTNVGLTGASGAVTVSKTGTPPATLAGFTFLPLPVITACSPMSGAVGSNVTITGDQFSTVPANNAVYFGPVKAAVVSASATSLTAVVPPGATYAPITVTVNSLTAITPKPFNVIFPGGAAIPLSQPSKLDLTAGTLPKNVAIADFDGDGKPDLAVPNKTANTVYVYRNTGVLDSIKFASPLIISSGVSSPARVIAADVDGDGKLDLVVTNPIGTNGPKIAIFRNTGTSGTISFAAAYLYSTSSYFNAENPESIVAEDFDGNGKIDFAVANLHDANIALVINKSIVGSFSFQRYDISVGSPGDKPTSVALKDIDGDGKPDLIVGRYNQLSSGQLYIYRNLSTYNTISLATALQFTAPKSPMHISVADLDGDGKPDIVLADSTTGNLFIYRNQSVSGSITLDAPIQIFSGTNAISTAIGDIDGDGKPDIAVSNRGANTVSLFMNTGSPGLISFAAPHYYAVGTGPEGLAVGDLNGDKRPEIISANSLNNKLSVMYWPASSNAFICTQGTSANIAANITGSVYQWQADTGTGFGDISDNSNYAGTNTNTLQLTGIITGWYGYKFRCVADGIIGQEFTLKFRNTWTGAVSNAWENPANWSCNSVPDASTDVVINAGSILINSNVTIRSLSLNTPAVCTVTTGHNFVILY